MERELLICSRKLLPILLPTFLKRTEPELDAYKRKWEKALNSFKASHFDINSNISLSFPLDEGVALQIPIVFSEIEYGQDWRKLVSLIGKSDNTGIPAARL